MSFYEVEKDAKIDLILKSKQKFWITGQIRLFLYITKSRQNMSGMPEVDSEKNTNNYANFHDHNLN